MKGSWRIQTSLACAIAGGGIGAVAGAAWLMLFSVVQPTFVLEFDRDPPAGVLNGFYGVERAPDGLTFAWTGASALVRLPELERGVEWTVEILYRAARPDPASLPDVSIVVDGATLLERRASNDFEPLVARVPAAPGTRGLAVAIRVSNTFVPSERDRRALGLVIDRVTFEPLNANAAPPPRLLRAVAAVGALFGLGFGLAGIGVAPAAGAAILLTAGCVAVASRGFAPHVGLPWLVPMAALVAGLMVVGARVAERRWGRPLSGAARFAVAFSSAALFLKLLVLVHPDMPIGDAMFHAHRFEWVLSGRYYFTSVAPGGYQFPYGIALYLTAMPFAALADNVYERMQLLRILVAAADGVAGLLVYPVAVRATGDRLSGALAVTCYHLVPLGFGVQTVGNQTNAFGQSLFVAALAIIATGWLAPRTWARLGLLIALASWAMIAHLSTFAILLVLLPLTALAFAWRGNASTRALVRPLLVVALVACGIAILAYYGHFAETYRTLAARIAGEIARPVAETDPGGRSLAQRLAFVPYAFGLYFGWPMLALGLVGAVWLWLHARGDTPALTVGAWSVACGLFLVLGVFTPVDMRHYLAWFPALAILAAVGAWRLWRSGVAGGALATALLAWSAWLWLGEWLRPLS